MESWARPAGGQPGQQVVSSQQEPRSDCISHQLMLGLASAEGNHTGVLKDVLQ